ncbi:hypothetical protein BX659_102167 [Orenia metallireducens]|uniref:DUF5667 domain-containing protein n=1 Tax=Orenia metallireducens TaxID=1413210 RepID=UPI000D053795|nr:DUF5667 domain-containing protein [Orenia metallireducens]PRX34851.1 hypothetical protein BX659_102167 [Orenia metallireducens]
MLKKTIIITLLFALITIPVLAKEEEPLPKKGLGPDSPFYFLDKTEESISYLFASKKDKVKLKFRNSYERLLEAKDLFKKDKDDKAKELFKEALNEFSEALRLSKEYVADSEEFKRIKVEITNTIEELKDLIVENNLSIEALKEKVNGFFD